MYCLNGAPTNKAERIRKEISCLKHYLTIILAKVGLKYDPFLGRKGNELISGEESELLSSVISKGMFGVWLPRARVKHFIPRERLTRKYVREYFRGSGVTAVRMQRDASDGWCYIYGVPRWLVRTLIANALHWVLSVIRNAPSRELDWVRLQIDLGQVRGYLKRRKFRKR